MSETSTSTANAPDAATLRERVRLTFDLDVDICIVGAGLAGLTVALETARLGASVAVLEGRHVGWNASGHQLGTVMPGFGLPIEELIERVGFDPSGIRKRIVTPTARLRASHIVLAGNIHLGAPLQRLSDTLLPVWRYAGVTVPLGGRLAEVIAFRGSVSDTDGIDHFRIVDGDRLMWASPETTWAMRPQRFAGAITRRIRTVFPRLDRVDMAELWSGAVGQTVHG